VKTITAEVLFAPESEKLKFLPEGPIDLGAGKFSWVAIAHGPDSVVGSLNVYDLNTGTNGCFPLDGRPGFALPTEQPGQFVVGLERRIELFDIRGGEPQVICDGVDADVENTTINDGVACSQGVIFGTKHLEFSQKIAGLYFLRSSDQKLFPLCGGQICSNGKVILEDSAERVTFLDIDTPTKTVVKYTLDPKQGTLSAPEVVLDLHDVDAFPDGMVGTPDGKGVIISFYNPEPVEAGETRYYSLESQACEIVWETPKSPQNTCPLLMERDGKIQLVITTAVEHMSADRQAEATNAGALFIAGTPFEVAPATTLVRLG
jgi:sugar lactone lactonase YvrE